MDGGRSFADALKANSEAHHGIAFRTYAQAPTQSMDEQRERLRPRLSNWQQSWPPRALAIRLAELSTGLRWWPQPGSWPPDWG